MKRNEKQFLAVCIAPQVGLIVILSVLLLLGVSGPVLGLVSIASELGWIVVALAYCTWDSRHRWPTRSPVERLGSMLMFDR